MAIVKPLIWNGTAIAQAQPGDTLGIGVSEVDVVSLNNANAGAVVIGRAAYISASGSFNLAQANAGATKNAIGLVTDSSVATGQSGKIQTDGVLAATTAQWDTVTGQTGGLTPGAVYYISPTVAGGITPTAPSSIGQYVYKIGVALSLTQLDITCGNIDIAL